MSVGLGQLGGLASLVSTIIGFVRVDQLADILSGVLKGVGADEESAEAIQDVILGLVRDKILVTLLIISLIWTGVACTMLVGAMKKKPVLLIPWLALTALSLVGMVVALIYDMLYLETYMAVSVLIAGLIQLLLLLYFWLAVFSFYQELRQPGQVELESNVEMKQRSSR